jgi:ATP-dependent Clp protease protease subunit
MKNQKAWTITAKSSSKIEILLYEMIGHDFWSGEGTTAKSFAEDLKAAGPGIRKIHLRVNSPGGNVFDGLAIYNTLLAHGALVTAQVDGLSASIASVITMAASEISMGDNALMMIHNPSTAVGGDAPQMRKMAETLDKVKTSMITAYRRHTRKSVEQVGALMDAETWMTAEETVESGFAEKIITPEGDTADVAASFAPVLARFRNVPRQIVARYAGDDDDWRRRKNRQRTIERHEMELADMRRETMAMHAIEIANIRAADAAISDDLRRRLTMAARERELCAWRAADFVWEDCYIDGFRTRRLVEAVDRSAERRRLLAQREIELGRRSIPTFVVGIQL